MEPHLVHPWRMNLLPAELSAAPSFPHTLSCLLHQKGDSWLAHLKVENQIYLGIDWLFSRKRLFRSKFMDVTFRRVLTLVWEDSLDSTDFLLHLMELPSPKMSKTWIDGGFLVQCKWWWSAKGWIWWSWRSFPSSVSLGFHLNTGTRTRHTRNNRQFPPHKGDPSHLGSLTVSDTQTEISEVGRKLGDEKCCLNELQTKQI